MPSEPKNHHYIPEMILRRFRSISGELFYFNKRKAKPIEHRNTERIFCERHLYSSVDASGKRKAILERFFSRLESDAAPLFDEIENIVFSGRLPTFSEPQKTFLIDYTYRQWKRVPDVHGELTTREHFDEVVNSILRKKFGDEDFDKMIGFVDNLDERALQRIYQNAKIQALSEGFDEIIRILSERELIFIIPKNLEKTGFVIGSNPIIRETYGQTSNLADKTGIIMPLSKRLAIGFGLPDQKSQILLHDNNMVRALNLGIVRQSSEVAGPSKRQLASLLK